MKYLKTGVCMAETLL